jgi:hypothetical protein
MSKSNHKQIMFNALFYFVFNAQQPNQTVIIKNHI